MSAETVLSNARIVLANAHKKEPDAEGGRHRARASDIHHGDTMEDTAGP